MLLIQTSPSTGKREFTTPRHGDRPWAICHLDHTQLDLELVSSKTKALLGRPWVTFLSDAYSRRILAFYLTFDAPSYRSCMMVERPISLWDSEYGCAKFVKLTAELNSDKLMRLRPNRCVFGAPPPYPGTGRPKKHGHKMKLSDPTTWGLPVESIEIDDPTWGVIEIQRWSQFHFYHSADHPMEIIRIQRQGKGLSKKAAKPMWLAWIGLEKLSLESLWQHYLRRFAIEHWNRFLSYQADCDSDLVEFQRVLKSFGEKMTLEQTPELEIHWEFFYERSIGCVGILKDWLTQAYCKALHEEASTLSEHHWQPYAPSIAQCLQIAAEAIEGEKAFEFESPEVSLLRQKLGLSKVSSSTISSGTSSVVASSKKTKGRPGVRQPNRDVIGGA
ncbi:MAG: transposase [Waterburya sp.]